MTASRRPSAASRRRPAASASTAGRARPGTGSYRRNLGDYRGLDERRRPELGRGESRYDLPGDTGFDGGLRENAQPLRTRTETKDTVLGPHGFALRRIGILAVIMAIQVVTIAVPVRTLYENRDQERTLTLDRSRLEHEIANLERERDKLNDPQYVEAQARQRFGAIKPGETPYRVVDDQTAQRAAEQAAAEESAAHRPWNEVLWRSVAGAPAD